MVVATHPMEQSWKSYETLICHWEQLMYWRMISEERCRIIKHYRLLIQSLTIGMFQNELIFATSSVAGEQPQPISPRITSPDLTLLRNWLMDSAELHCVNRNRKQNWSESVLFHKIRISHIPLSVYVWCTAACIQTRWRCCCWQLWLLAQLLVGHSMYSSQDPLTPSQKTK